MIMDAEMAFEAVEMSMDKQINKKQDIPWKGLKMQVIKIDGTCC